MKKIIGVVFTIAFLTNAYSQSVKLVFDKSSPQARYAADRLGKALSKKGYAVKANAVTYTINIKQDAKLEKEAYNIQPKGNVITVNGGDGTGMIYGSLSIAEDLGNNIALKNIKPKSENAHYLLRAVKYDLPWDTYRHQLALDQHYETCRDLNYWKAFLDMMVDNRLNALSVWNLHPFNYMIKAKNFPEATQFNDAELKEWQKLFHGIFGMAKERGIDTYLIPFNIFVSPAFSKAHNTKPLNLDHDFFLDGDTSEIVKRYTRESITQTLQEYPELTGLGYTLGEGMGGMTSQAREDWMREVYMEGMRLSGRKVILVHRIRFQALPVRWV
jgi:hypothetical protein